MIVEQVSVGCLLSRRPLTSPVLSERRIALSDLLTTAGDYLFSLDEEMNKQPIINDWSLASSYIACAIQMKDGVVKHIDNGGGNKFQQSFFNGRFGGSFRGRVWEMLMKGSNHCTVY